MGKKLCLGLIFSFSSAFSVFSLAWGAGAALEKVRMSTPARSLSTLHIRVAQEKGFFRKYGLEVEAIQMRPAISVVALISGEVQYLASVGSAVRAAAQGAPITVVAVANRAPFFSLVARPQYRNIQELKGKEIGLTGNPGGTNDRTMRLVLKQAGIDPEKDVKLIYAGEAPVLFSAFMAGRFDAMFLSLPFPVAAEQKGFPILVNAAERVQIPLSGLAVTTGKLKSDRAQVKRVLKAQVEAQRFIKRDKEATLQVMMSWLGLDRVVADRAYELYIPALTQEATVEREGNRRVIEMELEAGIPLRVTDVDKILDPTVAEEVNRELARTSR